MGAMTDLDSQREYWNTAGTTKTFGHPPDLERLAAVDRGAKILDDGCGYGRLVEMLTAHGFTDVEGVDPAAALVEKAHTDRVRVLADPPHLPHATGSVDVVLLFAVLTCIPADQGQRDLIAELSRVLAPGGLLYLSDLCLQDDPRNLARYERDAGVHGTYGVFETGDGALCRHHTAEWLLTLLAGFTRVDSWTVDVRTMNGHPIRATQSLLSKP
jgi:SAM-dependent methyltransferase